MRTLTLPSEAKQRLASSPPLTPPMGRGKVNLPATAGGMDLIRLLVNLRNLWMASADEGIAAEEVFADVSDGIVKCLAGIARPEAKLA